MLNIEAIDLFCGIGGLTHGVSNAGIPVIAGFDIEKNCEYAYTQNNNSNFYHKDIRSVKANEIEKLYNKESIRVLMGCAPCQPFSSYSYRYKGQDSVLNKMDLLDCFSNFIEKIKPEVVSMENVPQLINEAVFTNFLDTLYRNNYCVSWKIIYAPDYAIPQKRKRLVLLASKLGEIEFIPPLLDKEKYVTVRDAIGHLPAILDGEENKNDVLHRSSKLSKINKQRIQQSVQGGNWKDWNENLRLECHKKDSGKSYTSVYGRMSWDKVAPTITTKYYGYGNGRFGHPEQDRAISLREGAILQTFPPNYQFFDPENMPSHKEIGVFIGNAVPVKLGEAIGMSILNHLNEVKE